MSNAQAVPRASSTLSQTISNLEDIEGRIRRMTSDIHRLADQVTGSVAEIRSGAVNPQPPAGNIFQMVERISTALNEHGSALDRFNQ
jgi:methyl-accepting chemotaxis protein